MSLLCRIASILVWSVVAGTSGGCFSQDEPPSTSSNEPQSATPSNRLDVGPAVRQNLGISFAKVQKRPVRRTLRFPGAFELRPEATLECRVMASGRISLKIRQFDAVEPDTVLYLLDAPEFREMQHEAVEAEGQIKLADAALNIALAQQTETEQSIGFLRERLSNIHAAQSRNIELESRLAELENQLPRLSAEVRGRQVELEEAHAHYRSRLRTLASLTGLSVEQLLEPVESGNGEASSDAKASRWMTLEQVPARAGTKGIVSAIAVSDGGWVDAGGLVLTVVDPESVRFRAHALQSDMGSLRDGQSAFIVPPHGSTLSDEPPIEAEISLGYRGDASDRTIPLYASPSRMASWVKPGVSAFLEVFTAGSEEAELSIPTSAVVRDGMTSVIFRRDPKNPDAVIRMEADVGISDGRWIVINSGVGEGDEVVVDGAYQLMLASSGTSAKAGHFHADGTFHEGDQ